MQVALHRQSALGFEGQNRNQSEERMTGKTEHDAALELLKMVLDAESKTTSAVVVRNQSSNHRDTLVTRQELLDMYRDCFAAARGLKSPAKT